MRRLWPDPADVDDVDALLASDPRPAPPERPWLLVNMITSLDGSVAIAGRSGGLGAPADKAVFHGLRAIADVVMAGAGTVRAEHYGRAKPTEEQRAARRSRGQEEVPRIAVVTRSADLDPSARLFAEAGPLPIVLTCDAAPPERRRALEEVAEVVVAGHDDVDMAVALAELRGLGASVVTCEGGPHLNGDLVAADLVDEWALTLSPMLVGGTEGRAAIGPSPVDPRRFHLDRLLEGDGLLLGRWVRDRSR
jgi:5-amino-6-(5-phosphoribosylamino)uracil reductase